MVKITIMIPAYNVGKFVSQTLESALQQTGENVEILLINDGSKDDTFEIARWYKKRNPERLRVLTQQNQGTGITRNRLLRESRGEILLGLDADDLLNEQALEKVVGVFQSHPEIGFVYTDQAEIDEKGNRISSRKRADCHNLFDELIYHCLFAGHLRVFRKSHLKGTEFDPKLRGAVEDWDFSLKLHPHIQKTHISEELYSYRINTNGLSLTQQKKTAETSRKLVKKYLSEHNIYPGKEVQVVPADAGNNLIYYDHLIEGKSTMRPETKTVLERYLREGH